MRPAAECDSIVALLVFVGSQCEPRLDSGQPVLLLLPPLLLASDTFRLFVVAVAKRDDSLPCIGSRLF